MWEGFCLISSTVIWVHQRYFTVPIVTLIWSWLFAWKAGRWEKGSQVFKAHLHLARFREYRNSRRQTEDKLPKSKYSTMLSDAFNLRKIYSANCSWRYTPDISAILWFPVYVVPSLDFNAMTLGINCSSHSISIILEAVWDIQTLLL